MTARRFLSVLVVVSLATQLGGCSWWHKRQVKKTFESVKDPATTALTKMKDADAKVITANKALTEASDSHADTDVLVDKIHDFAVALQAGVPAAKSFREAIVPLEATTEGSLLREEVVRTVGDYASICGVPQLKLDDIDRCGGAYDQMLGAAYLFQETAKEYEVTFPVVRAPDKDAKD